MELKLATLLLQTLIILRLRSTAAAQINKLMKTRWHVRDKKSKNKTGKMTEKRERWIQIYSTQ